MWERNHFGDLDADGMISAASLLLFPTSKPSDFSRSCPYKIIIIKKIWRRRRTERRCEHATHKANCQEVTLIFGVRCVGGVTEENVNSLSRLK